MNSRRFLIELLIILVLLSVLLSGCSISTQTFIQPTNHMQPGNDWPMYGYNPEHSSINNETTFSLANIGDLAKLWSFKTQDVIAASAIVVGYTIYVGSWDGYEYAIDSQTGALDWKTYLGKTTGYPWCGPPYAGVSSAASFVKGTLYVSGGDSYWYALDASSGAILWKVFIADNSAKSGYYNWSTALIYNNYAYLGTSSLGDCPLAQGKLLQISLSKHKVVRSLNIVPNGQVGGGIWSSPVLDPTTNTLYVTTGNENALTQIYAQAILAIDPQTLTVKDLWRLPEKDAIIDSDFGGTPAVFQTSTGVRMIVSVNKNGIAYAFRAKDLKAGPIWQQYIAEGGPSPDSGDGSISTAVFANGTLYMAGGNAIINNQGFQGTVDALNPNTGKILWKHKSTGPILGALTYSNGMLFDSSGNVLEVLNATDGSRVASYTLDNQIYAAAIVSHGQVIVGDTDGYLYVFGFPPSLPGTNQLSTRCGNLTCWEIGNPSHIANDTQSGSIWKSTVGGYGMNVNTDQVHFISENANGDVQVMVKIDSLQGASNLAQAGLMIRQDANPGSPSYAVFIRKNHQIAVFYRLTLDGVIVSLAAPQTVSSLPLYLEIQRVNDLFQAAESTDGIHYTLIPGSSTMLALTTKTLAGFASSAGSDQLTSLTTYEHLAISAPSGVPVEPSSTAPCFTGWNCNSVGNPEFVGKQSLNGQVWSIQGSGVDIGGNWDQFHFVWQQIPHDGTISANIVSQASTNPWSKSGLMMRQSDDPAAPFYAVLLTPGNGLNIESRSLEGLSASLFPIPTATTAAPPMYLEIARSGNMFSTYLSKDGVNWNYVLGSTVEIDLTGSMQAGMAVSSSDWQLLGKANFESVQVANHAPLTPTTCPNDWMCNDTGYGMLPGSQIYNSGSWLLQGAGDDIARTEDQFHGVWQTLSNNGSVVARVTSIQKLNDHSKAGVMLREGMDPGSPFYAIFATPDKGLVVEYREQQEGNAALNDFPLVTKFPIYLMVSRVGNVFNAYYSEDGVNWIMLKGETKTMDLPTTLFAGLAMTSHAELLLGTATFDSVSIG